MNRTDRFDDVVSDWLHADAEHRVPEHLGAVLLRTRTERQRPAWSSLERWLPVQTTLHLAPVPRVAWLLLVVGLVAAVALAALAIGSRHRQPAPPFGIARNGTVLYGGTDNDIHTLDPVTGATTALIAGSAADHAPQLSPDGTQLLFLRDTTTRDEGYGPLQPMLMVARDDGTDVRAITGAIVHFGEAAWSHDGMKVAVSSGFAANPLVQVITVDGSMPPVVIDAPGAFYLTFRPGDHELTFRRSVPEGDGLYAVGVDGHGLRTIVPPGQGDGGFLSPDGTKMAYQTWDGTHGTIHIVDVDSGVAKTPTFEPDAKATGLIDDYPQWSPDGTRLLFTRYGSSDNHLWVAPASGGHAVEIGPAMPNDSKGGRAVFSPDGSKVLAHFNSDGSTWLLDPSGSTPGTKLSSDIAETASWQRLAP